ncbi:MAG: cysteine--tRNA ligase [Ignavibacteria bacterium]
MLSLYNTLTKRKEEFIPLKPSHVNFYICGPTVYDYFHIGNARTFVMSDIIRRYLEYKGFNVKFVMNLTDIDDRIIKKSIEEKKSAQAVAEFYSDRFFEDIKKLKLKEADLYPKATKHIDEIVEIIKNLESKGFAYNVEGNVFYDVSKFKDYGKLSGKKIDELESGARVDVNEEKKNPLDFALWKKAKPGEPFWDSPWGKGRPGWHIECSAMSSKHLGETFDIHAGGNDLIFPHHENEIAQSEAANGKPFVIYWIHFGFLNVNQEKMSKSLGNFFTAREVLQKYSAETIRLLFSQTHYRGPLNFSDELLNAAKKGLEKLNNLIEKVEEQLNEGNGTGFVPDFDFSKYYQDFEDSMDDDFNSPQAAAVIFDFIKDANKIISEHDNIGKEFYLKVKEFFRRTAENVLGIIDFSSTGRKGDGALENNLIELLIRLRNEAKKEKNFRLSDQIRDELNKLGIQLQDSKDRTIFKVKKN